MDVKNLPDVELVALIKTGDVSAYTEIYRRYASNLYALARNATGDTEKAEDIVQEVFVALWRKRLQPDPLALKGWLLVATRFQVLKGFRQNKSSQLFRKRLEVLHTLDTQGDPVIHRELARMIPLALQSLPEDQQTIFRMHREEEYTYRQIAEQLGVSIKTVEKKMSNVLRHLHVELGDAIPMLALMSCQFFY